MTRPTTKRDRRKIDALRRRTKHLAERLALRRAGGAESFDKAELAALRWVLDEVLPAVLHEEA